MLLQDAQPQSAREVREIEAPISRVVLFPTGARMTRSGSVTLPEGRFIVRFEMLGGALNEKMEQELADGMSASSSEGTNVVSIEFSNSIRRIGAERIEEMTQELEKIDTEFSTANRLLQNARSDLTILDVFGQRIVEDSGMLAGTNALDLDALDKQLEFISGKRMAILQTREAAEESANELERKSKALKDRIERGRRGVPVVHAELEVATEGGEVTVDLTWFNNKAQWDPEFTIRTAQDDSSAIVELNALIQNGTGNNWDNVQVALSTAEADPMSAPPSVQPVTVDIAPENPPADNVYYSDSAGAAGGRLYGAPGYARVTDLGPATIYTLPGTLTLPNGSSRRLLVERFQTTCSFNAIARPVVVPGVWSRGTIRNAPELILLPGLAALFIDGSFVGQTDLAEEVAPGEEFDVWYGELPGIEVQRSILERETVKTGLLGGGRLTRTTFRITITNSSPKPIDLIVEDRMPVSRSGDIEVSLKNVSRALSTNPGYLENERPLGMLRWDVPLPAGGPDASRVSIEWTVNVSRSSEIDTTPIPE